MEDSNILVPSGEAFILLLLSLGLYHGLFQRTYPGAPRWSRIQVRAAYPALALSLGLPIHWLALHLPDLSMAVPVTSTLCFTGAILALVEILLCFLLDSCDGPRVKEQWQRFLRYPLYVGALLIMLGALAGLPVMAGQFQERAGSVLLLYLALHVVYTYIFKWLKLDHALAQALRLRLRKWTYVLMMGLVTYFALNHLKGYLQVAGALEYLRAALVVVAGIWVFEAALASLFDYYYGTVREIDIPSLFLDLARILGYTTVVGLCAAYVLHRDLGSLLVGSAVLSVTVGFALQETLGQFVAGLALRVARPFSIGDQIEILTQMGIVQKIEWRCTTVVSPTGDLVTIPNSKLAQEFIINHTGSVATRWRIIEVRAHFRHAPNHVKDVLTQACKAVTGVLKDPAPMVTLGDFKESSLLYRVAFCIPNFNLFPLLDSEVRESIWYFFRRNDIEIPYPARQIYYPTAEQSDPQDVVRQLLDEVDFFKVLDDSCLGKLSARVKFLLFAAGEVVCSQGEEGDSLYIIKRGVLRVEAVDDEGVVFLSTELSKGQYVGEMALLTGEPRSATVTAKTDAELVRLNKEDLRVVLEANPKVGEVISTVLAGRKLGIAQAYQEAELGKSQKIVNATEQGARFEQMVEQLLHKIRGFFSY